ncbi:MAG: translation initiation factor IF-2 [Phycisphaeraceae bacterium]
MAKAKRVYEVAKELGVASKAIVEKCLAESVPGVKDHMSVVKIGLEMTIREWFSDTSANDGTTAVETAEPVDLAKARKARRKRARTTDSTGDDSMSGDTATLVEEPPVLPSVVKTEVAPPLEQIARQVQMPAKAKPKKHEEEAETQPVADTAVEPVVAAPAAVETTVLQPAAQAPASTVGVAKPAGPAGRPNVPSRPKVVTPAGVRMNKPTEVKLAGPKVVRVEQPDVIQRPRSRRGPGGPGGGDDSSLPDGVVPGIARSRGPARGRGAGTGGPVEDAAQKAAGKRRALSTRRGRSAEALPIGSKRLTEADYAEQQARLNRSAGTIKRHRQAQRHRENFTPIATPAQVGGKLEIREPITIKSLSAATGIKATDIIKWLFSKGIMATINSAIGTEAAMEVAMEYNIELEVKEQETAEQAMLKDLEAREPVDVRPRPPVVTVMGHVDHGKTSMLDSIRKADVANHEAGGITQHVGAYRPTITGHDGKELSVVFLDTPGHEAFTSMRGRGAKVTDVVVLVVAADDGVMPQTIESINHAKAAGVPIIVALNKVDKKEATVDNIRKIYGQLAEHGLSPTEWGGSTEVVKISATKGTGIQDLLEVLTLQTEILDLKADYGGAGRGTVIESQMEPGRGSVARLLVQDGLLKVGDHIVIGRAHGRVRDITDDRNRQIPEAGPATPVAISGLDMVPDAGDKFYVVGSLQKAQSISEQFRHTERQRQLTSQTKVTLENLADKLKAGTMQELRVVLKADVQGSIDVLKKSLEDLGNDEVGVKVLHAGVGVITEGDVLLADASGAIVIGFHVTLPTAVREIADEHHVETRLYRIIYECTEDVTKALEGMLTPEVKEEVLGEAEVREVFKISKLGSVAGCLVTEGSILRGNKMRLVRDGNVITEKRDIDSLRRVKDDAKEVRAGTECGIRLVGFDDIKPGDRLICYKIVEIKRKLE